MEEVTRQTSNVTLDSSKCATKAGTSSSFSPPVLTYLDKIYSSLTSLSQPDFLRDIQHEAFVQDAAGKVGSANPLTSPAEFYAYMASPAASAMKPAGSPDLSAPITDYYISSSHNTYLTGNQLYSDSDASAYTNVLLRGGRCVEIDIWDGKSSSESSQDEETSSSSSSSSSDSSSDEEATRPQMPRRRKSKMERLRKATESHPRLHAISEEMGKLEGYLGHRRSLSGSKRPETVKTPEETPQVPARPEPRVLHGHTLTKEASFRDVCYAIRDSAFVTSDLPVIVSLEVHACHEQQHTMVEIMEEAWKGMLIEVTPEIEATRMPPPLADLKRKILIKVKYVAPTGEDKNEDPEEEEKKVYLKHVQTLKQKGDLSTPASTAHETPEVPAPAPHKTSKIVHALSKLAVFTKGFHFKDFTQPEAKVPSHVFSLSENAVREAHVKDPNALFEHNRHYFMRVYPKGLRLGSSNMDPGFFWRRGAQMVALNWQNLDKGMMLNSGMFAGEPGWVLKPPGYRSTDADSVIVQRRQLDLSIEFIAGQDLPLPPGQTNEKKFHPYVSCILHLDTPEDDSGDSASDDESDSEKAGYKRATKSATGSNPDFEGQKIEFPPIPNVVEDLSYVRFKIKDDEFFRDSLAGWACIRLNRLQEGYRLIHIYDRSGADTGGVLLVRITKTMS
ncbi:putative phosphoinositide-specific phospholipase C [Aspergillus homomorphus CBS 101889]|uniref:Phosphoinositide phospholipase C n=1 Tax=Aspergillus homomorphus (strain CBS 101889) TaxID=1450537 RepID=A0A395HTW1_ASPHC|nr:phosphoinositide-specific phospholipase C [Aspergillus homomorphus CBS 101889]RAL10825.1 phosphoinositide-specific phospholipase C [Aspergillus homomorphus CBS 101889]